jgi:hypothetical protein
LKLSDQEARAIIAFLKTLDSTAVEVLPVPAAKTAKPE